jgi:hypothetical protein
MQPIRTLGTQGVAAKALYAIAFSTLAGSVASQGAVVIPGSTFDLSIIGDNATGSAHQSVFDPVNDTYLVPTGTYSFGHTTTVAGVTVSSSQTVVGPVVTDTITITEPTSFDPVGTTFNGSPIETIVFDLGEFAENTYTPTTQNGLNFSSAIDPAAFSSSGTATYVAGTAALATGVNFNLPDTSIYATEGIYTIPLNDLGPYDVTSFTFKTTQVPEPVSAGIFGMMAGAGLLRRRRAS